LRVDSKALVVCFDNRVWDGIYRGIAIAVNKNFIGRIIRDVKSAVSKFRNFKRAVYQPKNLAAYLNGFYTSVTVNSFYFAVVAKSA
jgi:hypothetical protein